MLSVQNEDAPVEMSDIYIVYIYIYIYIGRRLGRIPRRKTSNAIQDIPGIANKAHYAVSVENVAVQRSGSKHGGTFLGGTDLAAPSLYACAARASMRILTFTVGCHAPVHESHTPYILTTYIYKDERLRIAPEDKHCKVMILPRQRVGRSQSRRTEYL
ncbi:uncharacterized protein LAESUDRAFT_379828 [Laetiporus sulphureus 93-53]|uniref:Uncharacterized protein n=1 Tax=Laetiporus sulphureus 93-53 TaxID=1314785 RepID=A0A165CQF0_9APHY|nr:uncharacterized protein LAESUDRAFT_379828 [Laetiporus sulphureus 93-53]KZT03233.1 hypothetical protein LAESUDRAFT_379828 [Laetiporus sulphureus 93-53]